MKKTEKILTVLMIVILLILFTSSILLIENAPIKYKNVAKRSKLNKKEYFVTATCYNVSISQCDSTPLITANNKRLDKRDVFKHKYIAVSRDLLKEFSYGDTVLISGTFIYDGYWIIQDCMNKRFSRRIDFLLNANQKTDFWKGINIKKK